MSKLRPPNTRLRLDRRARDDVVEVSILHVLDERQVRMELDLYLGALESIHAGGRIETLD